MIFNEDLMDRLHTTINECDEYFFFFTRKDPQPPHDIEVKRIAEISEERLFKMILDLFLENNHSLLNRFEDFCLSLNSENEDADCGPLTEEEINEMFAAMREKENAK